MTLRERLLAKLREPDYRPANNFILGRLLGLNKKHSAALASEIRQLVKSREIRLGEGGRVELSSVTPGKPKPDLKERFKAHVQNNKVESRPIFQPTPRGGAAPILPTEVFTAKPSAPALRPNRSKPHAPGSTPTASRSPSKKSPAAVIDPRELYGRIQFRAGGSAFVVLANAPTGPDTPAMQISPDDTGVALPGDTVAVRAYPGATGRRPGETVGRVTRIITREKLSVVGNVTRSGRSLIVTPDDPRFIQSILVQNSAVEATVGDKVVVKLDDWTDRRKQLTGTVSSRLGRTHEPRAELLGIYEKFNLATSFPADVEREATTLPDRVPAKDAVGRIDYR
ncbi:MAG: 3'-5' exonuclease, partial [Opitutaceae bacterium]